MSTRDIVIEVQYFSAIALQIVICVAIWRRRLQSQSRFFFAYIVWQTFSIPVLYGVRHFAPPVYRFYGFWINNAINVALGLVIVVEIFNRIFAPYAGIRRMARLSFLVAGVLAVLIGGALLFSRHTEYSGPILTFMLVTERSVRVVQLGLILTLFAITKYLHLRWKNYLFGVALGFGFYALLSLILLAVRMAYGQTLMRTVDLLFGTAYCAALLIWTVYALQRDAATIPITSLPSHQLEQWDEILKQMLSVKNATGSRKQPTFDETVDKDKDKESADDDKVIR